MKKLFMAMALLSGFAQFSTHAAACSVELLSSSGSVLDIFHAYEDANGRCRDALRECSKEKRQRNLDYATCETRQYNPYPSPGPHNPPHYDPDYDYDPSPYPNPYPSPYPTNNQVQVGDKVFPLTWDHIYGGTVISKNQYLDEYRVKSNSTGKVYTFKIYDLALPRGCVASVCVGDKVFPSDWDHVYGGQVIAISMSDKKLFIKSNSTGKNYFKPVSQLAVPKGCMQGYCVGQKVYPRTWTHSYGGQIMAINKITSKFTVKSNSTGKVYEFDIYDL